MINESEHRHPVSREVILESLGKIRELDNASCVNRVPHVYLHADGKCSLAMIHPEMFVNSDPEEVWHGRVLDLEFAIGVMPCAIADWLSERLELIETICSGLDVYRDHNANMVGALSQSAQVALLQILNEMGDHDDPVLKGLKVTQYDPEDYFNLYWDGDFVGLQSAEDVQQWVVDAVHHGEPFLDGNGEWIVLDVKQTMTHIMNRWNQMREVEPRPQPVAPVPVTWED